MKSPWQAKGPPEGKGERGADPSLTASAGTALPLCGSAWCCASSLHNRETGSSCCSLALRLHSAHWYDTYGRWVSHEWGSPKTMWVCLRKMCKNLIEPTTPNRNMKVICVCGPERHKLASDGLPRFPKSNVVSARGASGDLRSPLLPHHGVLQTVLPHTALSGELGTEFKHPG